MLFATGRVPNVAGLGLEAAGVAQGDDGAVLVDEHYRTSVPSIHAVGDVTARVQLTPVALGEAMVVVDHLFGPPSGRVPRAMDYEFIPSAVFTHPSVGTVGMTEAEARKALGVISIYRSEFKALRHTLSGSSERTLMKLVVDEATDRVVGLHMVGAEAGEIVQGFAVAMKAGATKAVFDATIGIHPTAAEEFVTMREPVAAAPDGGIDMTPVYVAGIATTVFGRHLDRPVYDLAREALDGAVRDAGCRVGDIGVAFYSGITQGALQGQVAIPGHVVLGRIGIDSIPIFNVESACASGSAAFHLAIQSLRSGSADVALALGAEKMNVLDKAQAFALFEGGLGRVAFRREPAGAGEDGRGPRDSGQDRAPTAAAARSWPSPPACAACT